MKKSKNNCVATWMGQKIVLRTPARETLARIEKLLLWVHKRKFPDVNSDDQLLKAIEEHEELFEAYELCSRCFTPENFYNYYYEMADVLMAAYGLRRFDSEVFEMIISKVRLTYPLDYNLGVPLMIEKWLKVYFEREYKNNRHVA